MLQLNNLSLRIAGKLLIDGANLSLPDGARAGLVGRNGSGKTSLFKAITGELESESGRIILKQNCRIGGVAQEAPGTRTSLLDFVLQADTERTRLLAEAETCADANRIAEIQLRLVDIQSHSAEARAAMVLDGLGFPADQHQRPCAEFSGGWRMRVALAAVLFSQPDLLLLDEPTNYLDLEGTMWLESYLARYPYTTIIISHDRNLLNKAVNMIVHLDRRQLDCWQGGFDHFMRQRHEKAVLLQKSAKKIEAKRKHLQSFVDRFRYKESKAKQAQSRLKMLERLDDVSLLMDEHTTGFHFPFPDKTLSPPVMRLENVAVGYEPGIPILQRINLRIDDDDRIGLLGANGNGKSTFAKLIDGKLAPQAGEFTRASKLKIAYFAQHQLEELNPAQTAIEHIQAARLHWSPAQCRSAAAQMGLHNEKMETKAAHLSGGEKARLLLGMATLDAPHLIILDEPTNHLDIDSRESLIEALNAYQGAVILISHDQHLLDLTVDRLWLVADGTVKPFQGSLSDYRQLVLTGESKATEETEFAPVVEATLSPQERRRQQAEARAALAPLRKQIKQLEQQIDNAEKRVSQIDVQLSDSSIYESDPAKVTKLNKERADSVKAAETAEAQWLELSEQLEAAMTQSE